MLERVIQLPPPPIPAEYLQPCEEPTQPIGARTQKTLVLKAEELREALALCNADKAAIKAIVDGASP